MKLKSILPAAGAARIATAICAAVLLSSSTLFAQGDVKIGASPTTIDANSTLHVQGTGANKNFKVNKVSTQVTIQDGTEGDGKVLTSDANGNASWQNTKLNAFAGAVTQVRQTMNTSALPSVFTAVVFQSETTDPNNAFTPSTGTFVAPQTGLYQVFGSTQFDNNLVSGTPAFSQTCLKILVNGSTNVGQACSQVNAVTSSASVSNLVMLNAGQSVQLVAGATAPGSTFQIVVSSFYAYKIGD